MHDNLSLKEIQKEWHGTLKAYAIGFVISLLLTVASFLLVSTSAFEGKVLIYTILALALAQAIVQLLFFLHVGEEAKPRWQLLVFYFMVLVLLIIAIGTIWIMHDLDERTMSNMQEMAHD